jgi:hypothetical protein
VVDGGKGRGNFVIWMLGSRCPARPIVGLRSIRRAVLTALLLIAAVAAVRRVLPGPFCAIRWPSPIDASCSRQPW